MKFFDPAKHCHHALLALLSHAQVYHGQCSMEEMQQES